MDKEANARRVVAAYAAVARESGVTIDESLGVNSVSDWDGTSEVFPWAKEGADPFEHPEGPAESVFVNEFACRGKGACPAYCCCVERDPGSFAWAGDTDAARFRSDAATWGGPEPSRDVDRRERRRQGGRGPRRAQTEPGGRAVPDDGDTLGHASATDRFVRGSS